MFEWLTIIIVNMKWTIKPKKPKCFCNSLVYYTYILSFAGVLPVKIRGKTWQNFKKINHQTEANVGKKLKVSKICYRYSLIVVCLYLPQILVAQYFKFHHVTKSIFNDIDWYVITIGYLISDLNNAMTLVFAIVHIRKTISILNDLTNCYTIPVNDCVKLASKIFNYAIALYIGYCSNLLTFIYVAWLRTPKNMTWGELGHHILNASGPSVIIRGTALIISTSQEIVSVILCLTLVARLKILNAYTEEFLRNASVEGNFVLPHKPDKNILSTYSQLEKMKRNITAVGLMYVSSDYNSLKNVQKQHEFDNYKDIGKTPDEQLDFIFQMQLKMTSILNEINETLSPALLIEIGTCLYTAVFYLYRLFVTSLATTMSNDLERVHYVVSGAHRMSKLVIIVILGKLVQEHYRKPLLTLQQAKVFTFSAKLQSQIGLVIAQWSLHMEEGYLNASQAVRIGPWLLGSILGNIITYLLVALQFQQA